MPQRRVWTGQVVVPPPAFNDDLYYLQRLEDLAIQKLISKLRAEALTIAILPEAAGHEAGAYLRSFSF